MTRLVTMQSRLPLAEDMFSHLRLLLILSEQLTRFNIEDADALHPNVYDPGICWWLSILDVRNAKDKHLL